MRPARYPDPPSFTRELRFLGVTGTNGKTSTTFYLASALAGPGAPVASTTTLGSYLSGSKLEVPDTYDGMLSAMRACLDAGGRDVVLEVTSEVLARGFASVWPFAVGVFTNLSQDHLDAHGSPEHYFASKAQLFHQLRPGTSAVLNGNDEVAPLLSEVVPDGVRLLSYGQAAREQHLPLDVTGHDPVVTWSGTRQRVEFGPSLGGGALELSVPTVGHVFADNALGALTAAIASGLEPELASARMAHTPPLPGRFERVAERPEVVIDYAHTPDALIRTLETARQLCAARLWLVFGAGGGRDALKRPLMGSAASLADRIVLTSDNPRHEDPAAIARQVLAGLEFPERALTLLDRREAIQYAVLEADAADVVVIAGKGHETGQWLGDRLVPFSDRAIARQAFSLRHAKA